MKKAWTETHPEMNKDQRIRQAPKCNSTKEICSIMFEPWIQYLLQLCVFHTIFFVGIFYIFSYRLDLIFWCCLPQSVNFRIKKVQYSNHSYWINNLGEVIGMWHLLAFCWLLDMYNTIRPCIHVYGSNCRLLRHHSKWWLVFDVSIYYTYQVGELIELVQGIKSNDCCCFFIIQYTLHLH